MRRQLANWEQAERFVTEYPRERVVQFSPKSLAILEIQSTRDLEVLTKIYSNSVLLGDQGPDGWGVEYATEFHMTNDSKIFPPRPKWEEWGYRPDEYSRWIKGPWKPIEQLYAELGVRPLPEGEHRCAQPPYHKLPLPRADIPAGVILSREATHYIRDDEIPNVIFTDAGGKPLKIKRENEDGAREETEVTGPAISLPFYEGRMIGQYDYSEKGWVSGKGRSAKWRDIPWQQKAIEPQYLVGTPVSQGSTKVHCGAKIAYMRISSSTNSRTMISTYLAMCPAGDSVFYFLPAKRHLITSLFIAGTFSSLAYDYSIRARLGGLNLSEFVVVETAVPSPAEVESAWRSLCPKLVGLMLPSSVFAVELVQLKKSLASALNPCTVPLTQSERLRTRVMVDAIIAVLYKFTDADYRLAVQETDYPRSLVCSDEFSAKLYAKGLWRVDKESHPEHRLTVLSLIAFHDLQEKIAACGGNLEKGIEAFCTQNDGEGWMLPETLRLADYGLGHDDRAKQPQPVRECFGPRFYDWQLAQTPEESWRECHLHARNLLGPEGYQALLDEIEGKTPPPTSPPAARAGSNDGNIKGKLFETEHLPLFDEE